MKRERRHELQQNELADWLAKTIQGAKPYQNLVLAALILVLVAILAYSWYSHAMASQNSAAWDDVLAGISGLSERGEDALTNVVSKYRTTTAFPAAAVVSGDYCLIIGCNNLFHDKAMAAPKLDKAIERYGLDHRAGNWMPTLAERAVFGLARAHECKATPENLETAIRYYEEVIKKWPKGAYADQAKQRLEDLKRPEIRQFYADFRNFNPKPPAMTRETSPLEQSGLDRDGLPREPKGQPGASPSSDFEGMLDRPDGGPERKRSVFEESLGGQDKGTPARKK